MNCKICNNNTSFFQSGRILNKYEIKYFTCNNCGFIQTEAPYWLDEAYHSPVNLADTGIISRNIYLSQKTAAIIFLFYDKKEKYLDYAGGYGIFTRLMRDIGFNFYSYDPYCDNLVARGFEGTEKSKYRLVTAFEVFEHFENPINEIEKILNISDNILFSTNIYLKNPPALADWWYYGLEHGQHISIYNLETLKFIANKYSLNLYTNNINLHLFTKKKINPLLYLLISKFSNHGLFTIIKILLKSKTHQDMLSFKNKSKS